MARVDAVLFDEVTGRSLRKVAVPAWVLRFVGVLIDFTGRFVDLETPATGEGITYATHWVYADDRKLRNELNIQYRPLRETLADTVSWLAQNDEIDSWWADRIRS